MKKNYILLLALLIPCMAAFSQCPTPTDLAFSNVTSNSATISWNGNADSYTVSYGSPESFSYYPVQILKYGDMVCVGAMGSENEETWTWGVKFDHSMMVEYNVLTKVGFFNTANSTNDITIRIYSDGYNGPRDLLLTKVVTAVPNAYQLVILDTPLPLPGNDMWITLEEKGTMIMSVDNSTIDDSRWIFNGSTWVHPSGITDKGFMIHGHVENHYYNNIIGENQVTTTNQSIELTGLNPEQTYVVKVQGHCDQGDDSEWSDELIFITKNAGCPGPTGLTVSNITHNTAELDWSGESESFMVRYRNKAHDVGFFEQFTNNSSTPSGWSEKAGSLTGVQNGTVTLTDDQSWSYGSFIDFFDDHAYIDIQGTMYKWLISPSVAINEGSFLNFDIALTRLFPGPAITNETDRFIVAVYDESEATWNIHREWNNLSNTGENVNIDLSAYAGKNVRVAFYVEQIENPYELTLHIDNVRLSSPVPLGAWQTAMESASVTHATLTDLVPETPYEVEVRGMCSGSISMVADTLSFSTTFIVPSNLVVDDITIDAATLSWTENSEATSWQIQLNDEAPVAVSTNPFTLTGLTPDTEYTVKVRSHRGGKYSGWSDAVDFSTLFYCYPPTQLEVVECTLNSATLGWHDHGTADEWQVRIDGDENNLITVNTNQYVMTGLDAQTQYTVKVRAICGETYTDWTDEVSFVPFLFCNPPTLTVDDVNMTTADLSWTAIAGADSYIVSYHSVPVNAIDPIITGYTATDGTSGYNSGENYTNLVDNDRTTKWCRSKDNVYIEFHSELSFIPTGYILTTGNDNETAHGRNPKDWVIKAKLEAGDSWTTIANVTNNYVMQDVNFTDYEFELNNTNAYRYFRFEVSAVQSGNSFQLGELRFRGQLVPINTTSTSVSLTGLIPNTDYVAEVRGNIGDLSTNWSNEVNFTTLPVCAAPTDLSTLNVTCNSMILSWNQDGTVDDWRICLNNDETNLITATTNPYTVTGLSAQTAYSVKVCARKGEENYSYWSEPLGVSTTAYYQEPTSFAAAEIHSDNVVFNWNENSGADEWRLCLNDDINNLITVNTRPFTLTGLTPESTYTARISAYHNGSFSGWSNQISFTTPVIMPSLMVSNVNQNSANLNWTNMSGASYTVRYNRVPSVLETFIWNGFESGMGWTFGYFGTTMPATSVVYNSHNGSCGLKFVANSNCSSQFIVSPAFEECLSLELYYKTENTNETFQIVFYVGNTEQSSTNEITVNSHGQWQRYTCDIPEGTTGLRIKYCGQSESALVIDDIRIYADHLEAASNTNSTQLTNLFPVKTYSAKVRTKHGDIYSEWSDAVEFITYMPPTSVTVSDIAEAEATISWNENGDATQWQICLNNDQNNLIDVSTNPFTLTGLTQETHYTVKIRDCHELYNSAWCDAVEFTTLAYCAAPTDLTVDDIMRHLATLSWNADSDTYKVMYRTTGDWILAAENISENTFTLTGLDAETHYEARVIGVCNGFESNPSSSIGFTTLLDSTPTLTVDDITSTSAGLFWTETPGADSYTVSLNNSIEIPVSSGYTATAAEPEGSDYEEYYHLVDNNLDSKWYVHNAVNGVFGGAFIEFHSQHDFVPAGYVLTTAKDTDSNHPGRNPKSWVIKAKLHIDDPWAVIESVTNNNVMQNLPKTDYEFTLNNTNPYRYFRFEVLDVQNTTNARLQLGEMRFLGYSKNSVYLTDLNPATAYSAKVRAKIGEINGEWSDEVNFSTLYLTPTNLTVTNVDYTSATLGWTENGDANHWQICLNDDEDNLIDVDFNPFTITGLSQHTDYAVKVRVKQGEGYSSWSDIAHFTTLFDVISPTLTVNNVTSTTADLNWTAISGVYGYTVCLNDSIVRFPSQIITDYDATRGTQGNPSEDYPNLVDNDRSTKWCTGIGDGVFIEFQRESGFIPTGYILTTGNDNASKKYRNPKDWVIKAKLKEWEDWTTIATVSNDNILQDENTTDYEFAIDNHAFYRYFRFEVSATQGSDVFQLGELRFLGEIPTNSLHLTNLHPETDYAVKVRCDQEGIHSEWSNTVNFRTLYLPPTELTVSNIDHCSATLGWTSNSNIAQWQICLNGDEDHLILTNANPYILTGLNQHTHYTVKVRNCQVGADDAWSDEIEFTTHFDVTSLTLNVNNVTSTSADLNWTEISGVDGYTVCLNDSIVRFPSQIITDYDATRGTPGNSGEDYPNLVDNDRSTKWCTGIGDGVFIEFQRESGFIPTGYILTTGNDNASKHGRNPKNWVIKAKLNEGDEWTTIATVTNDTVLQDVNCTDFEFPLNNRAAYRYFHFEVSATQGSNVFQLGEMRFLGEIPTNSLHLTNLLPETDYAVKVRCDQEGIHSEWSNTVNFRTLYLPPTELTVSNIDHCSATLDWTSNSNITQWQICLNGDEEHLISTNAKPFTLTGLSQHTHYTVKVRNCQEGADDEWSDEIEFTTLFDVTSPALTVNNVKSTSADLSWTENPLAINYIVSLNGAIVELGVIPTNSLHLTNLLPETDYAVKVRSDFGETQSEWSNTVYFRTLYQPPTNLTVSNIDHCSATLGWTSNSNITQWQICLNGDEEHLISTNVNPYTLTGLNHHAHYTVKVRNCQEGADDAWSDEIGFTTLFNIIAPTVTVSDITLTTAVLNWEEIIGADGYTVSVNDSIIPDPIITGYTVTDGTSGYSVNEGCAKLVDNDRSTKWCRSSSNVYIEFHSQQDFVPTGYVLTTGNDAHNNPQRNPKNWVIKAKLNDGDEWTTIATVTNDNVLQAKDTTDYEFAIDNHAAYRYFRFEVSAVQSGDSFQLGELRFRGKTLANSLHLTNLLPETDYAVKVRSDFGETQSEWSNTVYFRTLYQPPTNLTVSNIDHCSATLGWTSNSNITQWQICLNGDEENLIMVNTNPYILTGLDQHTHYTVKVRNHQEGADDAWSDEIEFTTLFNIIAPTVTVNNITLTTAVLNWEEIIGADGYTVSVNDSIIPDPIITGYTVTDGTNGYSVNEGCAKLVDNDRSTKWCRWSNNIYIEFHSQHDFIPTGYVLTTAADAHKNQQRNPKDWVIKAKLNDGDEWTTIATVTNDNVLQAKDTTDYEFAIDNHAAYRYFRFEVSAVQSGDSFQLGELRFRGNTPANSRILSELHPETNYAVKVRANLGGAFSVWSEEVNFITLDGITFFADGNWNNAANWNVSRVPGADDDVYIAAHAVVPAGYTAQVKHANVNDGGSITIEDGGQFMADNTVKVAMQKNIAKTSHWGFGGSYKPDNWYFLASPVSTEGSDFGVTGIITEGEGHDYDLYRLNVNTWENYKAEGVMYHFGLETGRGYLYASENGTEIEFNGNAMPYSETAIPLSDGFNLIGNPYTFNTYVNRPYYRLNSDRTDIELVYDNTVIAPCEGVLVDVEGTDEVTFTKTSQQSQAANNGNLSITMTQQASSRGAAASDKAIVSFNEGSQLGKFYFTQQDANIYIPRDGKDYAIVYSDRKGEIALHFKATKIGRYTINFGGASLRGINLIDKIENVTIDLSARNEYTFIGAPNDQKDRFVLVFDPSTSSENDGYGAFAYQNGSDIIVSGNGELKVFDVMGRVVAIQQINGVETLRTSLQTGVYVFILDGKMQKIVVR